MANGGWNGNAEEWNRIEAPILALDAGLNSFAQKNGLALTKNLRDWPERSLRWVCANNIDCLFQVFLANDVTLTLNVWLCASQDRGEDRFWKNEMLKQNATALEVRDELQELLEAGKQKLDDWCAHPEEFIFATGVTLLPR